MPMEIESSLLALVPLPTLQNHTISGRCWGLWNSNKCADGSWDGGFGGCYGRGVCEFGVGAFVMWVSG